MTAFTAQNTARLLSAANTTNATSIRVGSTLVMGIGGFNAGTISYLKLYDTELASASIDATLTPRRTIYLPANTTFQLDFANPLAFTKGLGYRLVTGNADSDNTAVAAGAVLGLNIDWS